MTAASSSSSAAVPTGLATAARAVLEQLDDGSTATALPGSTLVLDEAARTSATERGQQVMTLFARRDVSVEQWITELAPLLTPTAATAYAGTDPRNVPPTEVTGSVTLTLASTALVARVSVPTDAGVYLVILSRTDQSPTWLADRIMAPESSGDP